jgi:hypothetical protein
MFASLYSKTGWESRENIALFFINFGSRVAVATNPGLANQPARD